MTVLMPAERIEQSIFSIRGQRVLLDSDLAKLYGVTAKRLNEQVRRNIGRFPPDFMFQLTGEEFLALRSHFATLKPGRGRHRKYLPYAFTEQGVAIVLHSDCGIRQRVLPGKSQIPSGESATIESFVQRGVAQMMLPFRLSWPRYVLLMGISDAAIAANLKELRYGR